LTAGLDRRAIAPGTDLEPADRSARKQANDHRDHGEDEAAEGPAEDDDDGVLLAGVPAAPHEQGDHHAGRGAAEHAAGRCEQAVNGSLTLGEGGGLGESHKV